MIKIQNENPCGLGDQTWWLDSYGNLQNGTIYDIKRQDPSRPSIAMIAQGESHGITSGAELSQCWPTKESCLEAERQRAELQQAAYKESITDAKDLVDFLFHHDVQSEYRDEDAYIAARERAKDLVGLDLDAPSEEDDFAKAVASISENSMGMEQ